VTVGELAEMICDTVGFTGTLRFDASKPDGTPQKLLDVAKLAGMGWKAKTPLASGLRATYQRLTQAEASESSKVRDPIE
jgi:GDP-L-fucose synthase